MADVIRGMEFPQETKKVIDGVGADAEIVTNANGGKQSKVPAALHLVDPEFLRDMIDDEDGGVINEITTFMQFGNKSHLLAAINLCIVPSDDACGYWSDELKSILKIGKVLQYGVGRYEANNWRLIPQEEHINHALIHYVAYLMGDTQDDHVDHCMCRLMMAYATERSEGFSYTEYIKKSS